MDTPNPGPSDLQRWAFVVTVATIGVLSVAVVAAPAALSFHSLADWSRDRLALTGNWPYLVPVALDATAAAYAGLTFYASLRGESAGVARLMVWVAGVASAVANYRHGSTISPDAAYFLAAMPLSAALLLDVILRRIRRTVLADAGTIEPALPRYRGMRWVIAPVWTYRAWRTALLDGIDDPRRALAVARGILPHPTFDPGDDDETSGPALQAESPVERLGLPAPTLTAAVAGDAPGAAEGPYGVVPPDLQNWTKKRAILHAFDQLGEINGGAATTWLAQQGFTVTSNYAYDVAQKLIAALQAGMGDPAPVDDGPEVVELVDVDDEPRRPALTLAGAGA